MNYVAKDYSPSCDPIFTFGNPECTISLSSTASCPVMGTLLNTGTSDYGIGDLFLAQKYKWSATGVRGHVALWKVKMNQIDVVLWCSNGVPNPLVTSLIVFGDVYPYYEVMLAYVGVAGNYTRYGAIPYGTDDDTKIPCESEAGGPVMVRRYIEHRLPGPLEASNGPIGFSKYGLAKAVPYHIDK
jgi:hypothetical protein